MRVSDAAERLSLGWETSAARALVEAAAYPDRVDWQLDRDEMWLRADADYAEWCAERDAAMDAERDQDFIDEQYRIDEWFRHGEYDGRD